MIEWKQERNKPAGDGEREQGPWLCGASAEDRAARDKALYYLQFSGKTESELRRKLAEQEFSPASVDKAVEFLNMYRYLDDEDYTRRYLEKNRNKKSRKQITYELRQKGVDAEILERVFADMTVDEEEQIVRLLEKKGYPRSGGSREERQKLTAFFGRKGFSYDTIQSGFGRYGREE